MNHAERDVLRAAVELLHGFSPTFRSTELVTTAIGRSTVRWEVAVFDLHGHATAPLCYAWTDRKPEGHVVHYRVVLHAGSVKSPESAVRGFYLVDVPAPPADASVGRGEVAQELRL